MTMLKMQLTITGLMMLLVTGCEKPARPCTSCPTSSLPAPLTCEAAAQQIRNEMPNNEMPNNGLTAASLAKNAALLELLSKNSLHHGGYAWPSSLTEPQWEGLLATPYAAELTKYIVSCAMDPCEQVKRPPSLADRVPGGFVGELGLCGKTFNQNAGATDPLWRDAPPTAGCLERVSACVLARVNGIEARVPISLRGRGLKTLPKVPVSTHFREAHGTPIQSFKPCDRMCLWGDPLRRNCDWEPRYVGQCIRGERDTQHPKRVRLELRGPSAARVRVCPGLYGCDDRETPLGAGAATAPVYSGGKRVTFPSHYSGDPIFQEQVPAGGKIEFVCPDNGPLVFEDDPTKARRTGYYSIMVGTGPGAAPLTPATDVALGVAMSGLPPKQTFGTAGYMLELWPDSYPATESQVYIYREGGFAGTLFGPPVAAPPCPESTMLGDRQFVCSSNIWSQGAAMFEHRLCAGMVDGATCFQQPPVACDEPPGSPACDLTGAAGPSDTMAYKTCKAAALRWPLTTYLSHPCDLFTSDEVCFEVLRDGQANGIQQRTGPYVEKSQL